MINCRVLLQTVAASCNLILLVYVGSAPSSAQDTDQPQPKRLQRHHAPTKPKEIPGEVIVKYKEDQLPSADDLEQRDKALKDKGTSLNKDFNSETIETNPESGWVRIKVPPGSSVDEVIKSLSQNKSAEVEFVRPNYAITLHGDMKPPPSDWLWTSNFESSYGEYSKYSHLWGLEKIGMQEAWALSHTQGGGVVIAVLDTGIDKVHPDLGPNYLIGKSFCSPDMTDEDGHGTYVAGIIAARGDNWNAGAPYTEKTFFVGVNRKAKLMVLKIACPEPNIVDAINAIKYAISQGASVISASWGLYDFDEDDPYVVELKKAIEAGKKTTVYVASAGNEDRNFDLCPSPTIWPQMLNLENLIVVGATNLKDELWSDSKSSGEDPCQPTNGPVASNYGKNFVHIAAPGENLWSILPAATVGTTGLYTDVISVSSGTSGATPLVAGCAALLQSRRLSLNPGSPLSPAQVKSLLMASGTPSSDLSDKVAGGTRLNCYEALKTIDESPPATPSALRIQ